MAKGSGSGASGRSGGASGRSGGASGRGGNTNNGQMSLSDIRQRRSEISNQQRGLLSQQMALTRTVNRLRNDPTQRQAYLSARRQRAGIERRINRLQAESNRLREADPFS